MPIFTTKLTHARLTLSPFSSQQMADIGQVMITTKLDRIHQALTSTDSPARPLSARYEERKFKFGRGAYGRAGIRNWVFRDVTLRAAKVKSASEDRVVIGFVNPAADGIVTVLRRRQEQWSDSPRDTATLTAAVRATFQQSRSIALVRRTVA